MHRRMNIYSSRILCVLDGIISFLILIINLFFHSAVSYNATEKVTITGYLFPGMMMICLIAGILLLFTRFQKRLEKFHQGWLFVFLSAVYVLFAAYLITNANHIIRSDANAVYQAALEFKAGNFVSFQAGEYLHVYPHQLGLVLYDLLLSYLAETPAVHFVFNTILTIGINYTCWKISMEVSNDRLVHLLTLLFSFAFLPQLFFIMFAYGLLPGWFCLQLAFLHTLRFCRTNRWKNGFAMLLFIAVAVLLRNNNLIGGIAMIIYLLLHMLRSPQKRKVLAAAAIIPCMLLPGSLVQHCFESRTGADLDQGIPTVLWVAMATNIDNRTSGPGWYDASSYLTYMEAGAQSEKAAAAGAEMLQQNVQKIRQEPARAALFFRDKVISTWCDPLYQSLWSGPTQIYGQTTYTPLLLSLYGDGKAEDLAEVYTKLLSLTIWLGVCLFLMMKNTASHGWQLFFLYLIGGFLFHFVWETKSQYVYPYVFGLLPFAAGGITQLIRSLAKHVQKTPL